LVAVLGKLVQRNSRRWKTVIVLEAVGLALSVPLAYLWLLCFLDNQLHLPVAGRLLASLGFFAGVGWAVRHLLRRWRALRLTEDQVALAIERCTPGGVHNRLINAIQIGRASRHDLEEAVVQENYQYLQQMHLRDAARLRPALLWLGLALLLVGVGLAYASWRPDQLGNAAARIFLPLARIDPLYRTRLQVDPGDAEAAGDLPVQVTIQGERPGVLHFLRREGGKLSTEVVPVGPGDGPVRHIFRNVVGDFTYSAQGGDFTSPFYQVTVPRKVALLRVRVTYRYPAYTELSDHTQESAAADLEALQGTHAAVTFVFDQPLEGARLLPDRPAGKGQGESQLLTRASDGREFSGELVMEKLLGYRLETIRADRASERIGPFGARVLRDQPPRLELNGLDPRTEVQPDSELPLQVVAGDDFGLEKVGLFFRRTAAQQKDDGEGWRSIAVWPAEAKKAFRTSYQLVLPRLKVAEGEGIELALRGVDTDPLRKGAWTTGAIYQLNVGGEGVGLQLRYEQILRSQGEIEALVRRQQELLTKLAAWLRKLDGGELRGDEPKHMDLLHAAVKELRQEQEKVRLSVGDTARAMLSEAGNVRVALGLLADSEMVRVLRILDSVPGRDQPPARRAALADGRLTLERILRSLQDLQEQYAVFRSDWELGHMIPYTRMLADRQSKLRDLSRQRAAQPATSAEEFHRQSAGHRQQKIIDLCQLIRPAFMSLASRLQEQDAVLARAFEQGAATLAGPALQQPLRQAADHARDGLWAEAARQQALAAEALTALHARLRQAQLEAARRALAALKEKARSDMEAQRELEKLKPGSGEALVKDFPSRFKVEDLQRIWDVTGTKKAGGDRGAEPDFNNARYDDVDRKVIDLQKDSGVRQDPYTLTLGKEPEKTGAIPMYRGKERNAVKPFIQEKFDDLVGKLLDEADELHKSYQTINLSTNRNNNDGGDIGKIGGRLNSTGAVTATGNKKPPTLESGGVSRTGRQGARAYGMVADQDTYNRKGRDQALEGQQRVADQPGVNKMRETDESQKDSSTGVGGKKIESEDSHFSVKDAGKWKDEYAGRMDKPQRVNHIVERQGDRLDPRVAAQLRDLTSKQEQLIDRLKTIRKELRNLYLPTEHLDELAQALQANLEGLKEKPEAELFRLQVRDLDRLRGALRVFQNAGASFQPSLPRERAIKGRVLDEPGRPTIPGYEEAVKQYYLKLASQ
jgi:hypothetical protein